MSEPLRQWIESLVGELTPDDELFIARAQRYFTSADRESPVSQVTEFHDRKKQKLLGIAYTPPEVRNELISNVLDHFEAESLPSISICDPCCGSGLFVLSLVEHLETRGVTVQEALERNIHFADIDRSSVLLSLANIYTFLQRRGFDATTIRVQVSIADFLTSTSPFDAYVTNPPYVKLQNLPEERRKALKTMFPSCFTGSLGLSALFLKHMLDTLTPRGILGIITQNNLFTSNAAKALRSNVGKHLKHIDTFGQKRVFADLTAYTCLLYLTAKKRNSFAFRNILERIDLQAKPHHISIDSLNATKWRLGSPPQLRDLDCLETKGIPLGKACRIWVGVATLCDKAFTVHRRGEEWISYALDGHETSVEAELVRPLLKVSDLVNQQSLCQNVRGILFPYQVTHGKATAIGLERLQEDFPLSYGALTRWKVELQKRDKGALCPSDWYKWGRSQSMVQVPHKLLTKTFSRGPNFFYDSSDSLFSNGYALIPRTPAISLPFVQAVLNSSLFAYYAKLTSFEIEGEYQCYQKNFIERFTLPDIPFADQEVLAKSEDLEHFLYAYFRLESFSRDDCFANKHQPAFDQNLQVEASQNVCKLARRNSRSRVLPHSLQASLAYS